MKLLSIGTRIFNGGDMANAEHFGTITKIIQTRWQQEYEITPDPDAERKPYTIPFCGFSDVYLGHGGTRFVTEEAYKAYRMKKIEEMRQAMAKLNIGGAK